MRIWPTRNGLEPYYVAIEEGRVVVHLREYEVPEEERALYEVRTSFTHRLIGGGND